MKLAKPSLKKLAIWTSLALTWSVGITLTFLTWNTAPAAIGVFVEFAVTAAMFAALFGGEAAGIVERLRERWRDGKKLDTWLLLAGALSLGLSFLLMVIKRYGYAPAGSDIVFLLETTPVFVIILAFIIRAERLTLGLVAGSAAALLGGMAVVGNWERPSSFSLFSRFPVEESVLVLAAVLLAVFLVILWRMARAYPANGLVTVMLWTVLPVLLVTARLTNGWGEFAEIGLEGYLVLAGAGAIGVAFPLMLFASLTGKTDAGKAATAIFLSPFVITLLIGVEKSLQLTGAGIMPTPFLWAPVLAGSLIILTGVAVAWTD